MKATATLEGQTQTPIAFGGELGPRIERTLSRLPSDAGVMGQFLGELAACNRAPKSIMLYLNAVQSLLQSTKKPIDAITKQDIIGWCTELEKKVKQSTATRYKILVRRFLKWFHTGQLDGDGYPETKDLLLKGQVSGGFLTVSGMFLFLGSIGNLPSGGLFRAPVEHRMEWLFLFFVGLGMFFAVMSALNMP